MFSRISTLPVLALALLAVATPNPVERRNNPVTTTVTVTAPGATVTAAGNCDTGPIQCCTTVDKVSDHERRRSSDRSQNIGTGELQGGDIDPGSAWDRSV